MTARLEGIYTMSKPERIYGIHAVTSALENFPERIQRLYVLYGREDQRIQDILYLAQDNRIPVQTLSRPELDQLAGNNQHQGIIAEYQSERDLTENDLFEILENIDEPPFLLVLDGIQDPHNLGACIRTANAAGVHAVLAPKDRNVALTPTARKVASGAAEITPFISVTNLARTLRQLREQNIWIYGLADEATDSLYETDLQGGVALVLGAEGEGLRRLTREHCDMLLAIPMAGDVSSLNVSVATGVCLFEVVRQRISM